MNHPDTAHITEAGAGTPLASACESPMSQFD
ncbi:peptide-methionine (R)-S-oxide reductase, partial [Xanthomonas perforans]